MCAARVHGNKFCRYVRVPKTLVAAMLFEACPVGAQSSNTVHECAMHIYSVPWSKAEWLMRQKAVIFWRTQVDLLELRKNNFFHLLNWRKKIEITQHVVHMW